MLLLLLLLVFLIYSNVRLARKKGKNPVIWGLISLAAFLVFYGMLGGIYISIVYKGPVAREAVQAYLMKEPLAMTMLIMLGIGGVLLVRYLLERNKDIPSA